MFSTSVWWSFLLVSGRGKLLCEQRPERTWSLELSHRLGRMLKEREIGRRVRKWLCEREYKRVNVEQGNHWPVKKRVWEGKCSCSTNTGLMFCSFLACSYGMAVHSLGHLWFGDSAGFREVTHWDLTCHILRYCHCGESSEVLYRGFLAIAMLDGAERCTAEWSGLRWEQAQITTTSGLVQIFSS